MMKERNYPYVGMNNLGLPTATVPRHMERTCLLKKESQKQREQKEMDGGMGGWMDELLFIFL